jgi:ribosomal protein S18 acetylase RimI-like enzyme
LHFLNRLPRFSTGHYSQINHDLHLQTTHHLRRPTPQKSPPGLRPGLQTIPTYQTAVPSDAYLQSLLAKPHFIAVTALHGNEVVGGLAAYVLEKFEQDRREIYIYDLAVSEAHRRKGLATRLIKSLPQITQERNAYVIFVQADPGDDPAIRL